ncbi:MAG: DoxX family protein [Candidatus Zixiibacteriota bacterium]
MANLDIISKWTSLSPALYSILRIVAAFIFILSGSVKLFGFPTPMASGGTVDLFSQIGIGAILEVFGGACILLGLFTRPVAFILAGEMAVAYFQFHFPKGFWPNANGGTAAALFSFIFLYISAAGAGIWSIDALRGKR